MCMQELLSYYWGWEDGTVRKSSFRLEPQHSRTKKSLREIACNPVTEMLKKGDLGSFWEVNMAELVRSKFTLSQKQGSDQLRKTPRSSGLHMSRQTHPTPTHPHPHTQMHTKGAHLMIIYPTPCPLSLWCLLFCYWSFPISFSYPEDPFLNPLHFISVFQ